MNVKTSEPCGIVVLVTMDEPTEATVTLYGAVPPVIVKPQGWHVARSAVTLGLITRDVEGGERRHDESFPSMFESMFECGIGVKSMRKDELTRHGV
jgi:hypothetical protein